MTGASGCLDPRGISSYPVSASRRANEGVVVAGAGGGAPPAAAACFHTCVPRATRYAPAARGSVTVALVPFPGWLR